MCSLLNKFHLSKGFILGICSLDCCSIANGRVPRIEIRKFPAYKDRSQESWLLSHSFFFFMLHSQDSHKKTVRSAIKNCFSSPGSRSFLPFRSSLFLLLLCSAVPSIARQSLSQFCLVVVVVFLLQESIVAFWMRWGQTWECRKNVCVTETFSFLIFPDQVVNWFAIRLYSELN